MSNDDHQDWKPVTWHKRAVTETDKKVALRAAVRAGTATAVGRKDNQKLQQMHKLASEQGDSGFQHATVSRRFSTELQKARLAKKLTQKQLALMISEKQTVINDYESGKARPNAAVITKLSRALGAPLPSAKAS